MAKFKIKSEAQLKKMSLNELTTYQTKLKEHQTKTSKKATLVKNLSKAKK